MVAESSRHESTAFQNSASPESGGLVGFLPVGVAGSFPRPGMGGSGGALTRGFAEAAAGAAGGAVRLGGLAGRASSSSMMSSSLGNGGRAMGPDFKMAER